MRIQGLSAAAIGLSSGIAAAAVALTAPYALAQVTFATNTRADYVDAIQTKLLRAQFPTGGERFAVRGVFNAGPGPLYSQTITWSYAADGTIISPQQVPGLPNAVPVATLANAGTQVSTLFQTLNAQYALSVGGDPGRGQALWQQQVLEAFQRWQAVSGIRFQFVGTQTNPVSNDPASNADNGDSFEDVTLNCPQGGPAPGATTTIQGAPGGASNQVGDIRILMGGIDGASQADGSGGGILAYSFPPVNSLADYIPYSCAGGDPNPGIAAGVVNIRFPSGAVKARPAAGNIVLDRADTWNNPVVPGLLRSVMLRQIGFALGLGRACPADGTKIMEPQFGAPTQSGEAAPPSQSPFPILSFDTPQLDDIRGIQSVYGDRLEDNNSYAGATLVPFDPILPASGGSTAFNYNQTQLSLSPASIMPGAPPAADVDFFQIRIPSYIETVDYSITVTPNAPPNRLGQTTYPTASFTFPATCGATTSVDARSQRALRIRLERFDPLTNTLTVLGNTTATLGQPTSLTGTLNATIGGNPPAGFVYYLRVDSPTASNANNLQLYDLGLTLTPRNDAQAAWLDFVPPAGSTTVEGVLQSLGVTTLRNAGITGNAAVIANVDSGWAWGGSAVFSGRAPVTFRWTGVNPTTGATTAHATAAAGAVGGQTFAPRRFGGAAAPRLLATASIGLGTPDTQGDFRPSLEGIYYTLFGLTDPTVTSTLGWGGSTVSVFNSVWGIRVPAPNDDQRGAGPIGLAHDAAAFMRRVTVVAAAGNEGLTDNTSPCGTQIGGNIPGGEFLGSKTIGAPATAFNRITVGYVGAFTQDGQGQPLNYQLVVQSSSKGPLDTFNFEGNGSIVEQARPGIDIVAPGAGIVAQASRPPDASPCIYGIAFPFRPGHIARTGLSLPTDDSAAPSPDGTRFSAFEGSSFATSLVSGAVALLQDTGARAGRSTDPLVLKSVLLTGAVKQPGWSNNGNPAPPQDNRDNLNPQIPLITRFTTQGLDYAQGAGVLDLDLAYRIYTLGTTDLPTTDPAIPTVTRINQQGNPSTGRAPAAGDRAASELASDSAAESRRRAPSPVAVARLLAQSAAAEGPARTAQTTPRDDPGRVGPPSGGGGPSTVNFQNRVPFNAPPIDSLPGVPGPTGLTGPTGPTGQPNPDALRLFFAAEGLTNRDDPNSAITGAPGLTNPLINAGVEPARFYIWAQINGDTPTQTWRNINFNVAATGSARIVASNIFNYSPSASYRHWSQVVTGAISPDQLRLDGVSLRAGGAPAFGVNNTTDATRFDRHFNATTRSTLLGYIEVTGAGQLFFEVGGSASTSSSTPKGISRGLTPSDTERVYLGFADESDNIFGTQYGRRSSIADASSSNIVPPSSAFQLFFSDTGLTNPDNNQSPVDNAAPALVNPVVETTIEPQRLYIWARILRAPTEQIWDRISFSIETTGTATIVGRDIWNYQPVSQFRRWDIVQPGTIAAGGQSLAGVNLEAIRQPDNFPGLVAAGVNSLAANAALDAQSIPGNRLTLLGWIEVQGAGEVRFRIGPTGIFRREGRTDDEIFLGFGDNPNDLPALRLFSNSFNATTTVADATAVASRLLPIQRVRVLGWDFGNIGVSNTPDPETPNGPPVFRNSIEYLLEDPLTSGQALVATLAWDRRVRVQLPNFNNPSNPGVDVLTELGLQNLTLEVFPCDAFGRILNDAVAASTVRANNLQHVVFFPFYSSYYLMRVSWTGVTYDLFNNLPVAQVPYALSWAVYRPTGGGGQSALNPRSTLVLPLPRSSALAPDASARTLANVLSAWGTARGDGRYDPSADLDGDGKVGASDLTILLNMIARP
ncbi:MAG: S8 family serine peptidase [Phycisphaerales bacterium]|nr:S8 family serine peptidase [Phycisphaerales bacterium]